jgi:hypothetical protein
MTELLNDKKSVGMLAERLVRWTVVLKEQRKVVTMADRMVMNLALM